MNKWELERQKFAKCFLRTLRGALPLSLAHSLAKECGITVYGNTKKYTTIDWVKYAVPDDVILLDNAGSTVSAFFCTKNGSTGTIDLTTGAFTAATFTAGKMTRTENFHTDIPSELYEECEYLGLQGNEYIDTNINPSNKIIGAVIDFQFTDISRTTGGIFGSNKIDGTDNCQFTVYTSKWRTKINNFAHYGANYDTDRHTVRFNMPDGTKLDNTVITNTQYTIASGNNVSLLLGACSYNGSANEYTLVGKLYPSKIYVDGVLARDYVSVKRLSDNQYGMYDRVTSTFKPNEGTGAFTGGPSRQIEVPICEYSFVGDRTENLYCDDVSKWTKPDNYYVFPISIEQGQPYRFKAFKKVDTPLTSCVIALVKSGRLYSEFVGMTPCVNYQGTMINVSFTADNTWTNPALAIYVPNNHTLQEVFDNYDVDLVIGTSYPSSHIPYGYDVPLRMTGVNLFDSSDMTLGEVINENGSTSSSSITNHSNYIAVMPNTTYVVKDRSKFKDGVNQITRYHAYGSDKTWLSQMVLLTVTQTDTDFDVTFTTPANCYYVRFTTRQPLNNAVIMMVKGSTAPASYHPYVSPVLRHLASSRKLGKIGTYIDTASIKDGVRTSVFWMGHKVFDGTEDWALWSNCFYIAISDLIRTTANVLGGYCTHFKYIGFIINNPPSGDLYYGYNRVAGQENNGNVSFKHSAITTVEDWKAYLAKQYAAGHPVEVWYPLATAVTETATETNVTLPENDVTMDAECSVKPSEAAVTFNSRSNY